MSKIAIIAALEREVAPLVTASGWQARQPYAGCSAWENDRAVVVCAGIGAAAARKAAEAIVRGNAPSFLISAGLAGGLTPDWKAGCIIVPGTILGVSGDGVRQFDVTSDLMGVQPKGTLVTGLRVAIAAEKRLLARKYQADAVDMEAAAVAGVANSHGIPFAAVKAISEEFDFPMPDLERFIDGKGKFKTMRFMAHITLRPAEWPVIAKLSSNVRRASRELCRALGEILDSDMRFLASNTGCGATMLQSAER